MVDIVFLIVIISLYVLIPVLVLTRRKALIRKAGEEYSAKALKQGIKVMIIASIAMLILLGISLVQLPHHIAMGDGMSFVRTSLSWFLFVYFVPWYIFIVVKPCIKEKESEE